MPIPSERRGRRAALTSRVATACAAVAALLAVAVPSASAYVPCPGALHDYNIDDWETRWPTAGADPKGVTLCQGFGGVPLSSRTWLQIVDLGDGAKVRVHAERAEWVNVEPYVDSKLRKRTAEDWYDFIRAADPNDISNRYNTPHPRYVFSTTNASFFKDSDNSNPTTKLPLPMKHSGSTYTYGVAMVDPNDPDHHAPKRFLRLGGVSNLWDGPVQNVHIGPFPTYYNWPEADEYMCCTSSPNVIDSIDSTVGFEPDFAIGDAARRNYIGTYGDTLYILTTDSPFTNAQANGIMQQIQPGMYVMQLDGGGSAQLHSAYGSMDSNIPIFDRMVPDVLTVYRAQ